LEGQRAQFERARGQQLAARFGRPALHQRGGLVRRGEHERRLGAERVEPVVDIAAERRVRLGIEGVEVVRVLGCVELGGGPVRQSGEQDGQGRGTRNVERGGIS